MGLLSLFGFIMAILGLLGLVHVISMTVTVAVILLVVGLALVIFENRGRFVA